MILHKLSARTTHQKWERDLKPVLSVSSGDEVLLETRDANGGYFSPSSSPRDAQVKPPFSGHPLTGPIEVKGAEPGMGLRVEVLEVEPSSFGHTAFYPGRGLLPDEFKTAHLQLWSIQDGFASGLPGVQVPVRPFLGVIGVSPNASGLSTTPPGDHGGNIDNRHLAAGSAVVLPVYQHGALLSVGDAHAAQGEGEVCGTAIEVSSVARLRLSVVDEAPPGPELSIPSFVESRGPLHGCTAHGDDLLEACRTALKRLMAWLSATYGLSRHEAYILSSVAGDLRLDQCVNLPNYSVTAYVPLSLFDSPVC